MKTIIVFLASIFCIGCYSVGTTIKDEVAHVSIVRDTLNLHPVNQGDTVAIGGNDSASVDLVMPYPTYIEDTTQAALESNQKALAQRNQDVKNLKAIIARNKTQALIQVQPPDVHYQQLTITKTPSKLLMLWKLKGEIFSLMLLAVLLNWLVYLFLKVKGISPIGTIKKLL